MSFKKINKTRFPMVDELGRLMNAEMQIMPALVDEKTGRRYFFTPPEEPGGEAVRRDLAVEVFRHHSIAAPAATEHISPNQVQFVDEDPANCKLSNLMFTGRVVDSAPPDAPPIDDTPDPDEKESHQDLDNEAESEKEFTDLFFEDDDHQGFDELIATEEAQKTQEAEEAAEKEKADSELSETSVVEEPTASQDEAPGVEEPTASQDEAPKSPKPQTKKQTPTRKHTSTNKK